MSEGNLTGAIRARLPVINLVLKRVNITIAVDVVRGASDDGL